MPSANLSPIAQQDDDNVRQLPEANKANTGEHLLEESDSDLNFRQYVSFQIESEIFAVTIGEVQEIILVPSVVRVPLSPPSLEGLANLRGTVLPIIDLRDIFKFSRLPHTDATRIIVTQQQGVSMGFIVDRVVSVLTVEEDEIESAGHLQSTVNTDFLNGMIKHEQQGIIMILSLETLVRNEFKTIGDGVKNSSFGDSMNGESSRVGNSADDEIQLVSFGVSGQEYALPIEQVQEIVQVPDKISHVPKSASHVIGVMTLRNRLLPLVSLREMFGLAPAPMSEHNRIIVTSFSTEGNCGQKYNITVGILMDTVKEVLRVNRTVVDELPTLLSNKKGHNEIQSICRIDNGKRLVSILSVEQMFENKILRQAIEEQCKSLEKQGYSAEDDMQDHENVAIPDDEEQFVVFMLAKEEYAVPIDCVQEIVRVPEELTKVPCSPKFIEGVVNLRGTVLPIIDQRTRFGLDHLERNDRQRIMVFMINNLRTGFIVDSVAEVLKIPKRAIGPAPNLSDLQAKLITRIANLERDKRIILLLDVNQLLDETELDALSESIH